MADMTGAVMAQIRNYFEGDPVEGMIHIDNEGMLHLPENLQACLYVAIRGSSMHDGVWRVSGDHIFVDGQTPELPAERFVGTVWPLHPPQAFINLCNEVAEFATEQGLSPVVSESFGGYSHTLATGQSGPLTWQERYASRMRPYCRMFTEVGV